MKDGVTSKMYFLSKFCRICIKSSEDLKDIECLDHDSIKFSEKLKICTKMVINKESISTMICASCIRKLRIAYEFDNMCKKSNSILQNYLMELLNTKDNVSSELIMKSELYITLSKLPEQKKPRHYVTKEKRCSLLKELLTKINEDKNRLNAQRNTKVKTENSLTNTTQLNPPPQRHEGLKPLMNFTRSYNYGYELDKKFATNFNFESSHLEKLSEFVNSYFCLDLTNYHDNINYILEQSEDWSDESDIEDSFTGVIDNNIKFEEVIVEPDINVKKEIFADENSINFDTSYDMINNEIYEKAKNIKVEPEDSVVCDLKFDDSSIPIHTDTNMDTSSSSSIKSNLELYPVLCQSLDSQSTLNLLQEYTERKFKRHRNTVSKYSPKCRTKNSPFISPHLKKQFLYQDFKCTVCNRSFKSQGYLSAHCSKMKHKLY